MNTHDQFPLVTLGIPAYNEVKFLAEAIDNLLAQSYPNLEILIADNGSIDGTSELCREYATKHKNIRHVRHLKNIGQNANFNYLPRCASGTYFCWVSGHDLLETTFVADCVATLEHNPESVLAYPRTINMTADGRKTREKVRPFDIRTMSAQRRFREVMWRVDCNYVYGMWRLSAILDSNLFQLFPAPDRVFLAEMALKGTFIQVDTFKYYRMNREGIQPELEKRHRLMKYLFPHRTFTDEQLRGNEFYSPTIRGFRRAVQDSRLPWFTRWFLYYSVWLCGVLKFHLFPGADTLSIVVKALLPDPLLKILLRRMR